MDQATRWGRMSESAVHALRAAVHKGECASAILNAIVIGRQASPVGDIDAQIAVESLPDICVHALIVALELLHHAYDELEMSEDDILATIPRQVAHFVTGSA